MSQESKFFELQYAVNRIVGIDSETAERLVSMTKQAVEGIKPTEDLAKEAFLLGSLELDESTP